MNTSPSPAKRRVTASDVAREANVSQATVSYVLNNAPHIKIPEETRKRVLDAAAKLKYTPSSAARALRLGRSDLVLLLLPNVPIGSALARILEYVIDEFEKLGLSLVIRRERDEQRIANQWHDLQPAAIVALHGIGTKERKELQAAGVFVFDMPFDQSNGATNKIAVSQVPFGEMQVKYLASKGHKRIGYAASPDERLAALQEQRLKGVVAACEELKLASPVVMNVGLEVSSAVEALTAWTAKKAKVTAICAYNDEQAFALLAGAHHLGLRVPEDMAVIGVDNIPMAPLATPALTSISWQPRVFAANVAAIVADGIAGKTAPAVRQLAEMELVVRASA